MPLASHTQSKILCLRQHSIWQPGSFALGPRDAKTSDPPHPKTPTCSQAGGRGGPALFSNLDNVRNPEAKHFQIGKSNLKDQSMFCDICMNLSSPEQKEQAYFVPVKLGSERIRATSESGSGNSELKFLLKVSALLGWVEVRRGGWGGLLVLCFVVRWQFHFH